MGRQVVEQPAGSDEGHTARGRAAADRADWDEAFAAFSAADASRLGADDLQVWATAAYLVGNVDAAVDADTRAHQIHLKQGDLQSAVRCGFWVAFMLVNRGDMAQAMGWFARCSRLVEGLPAETVEHGYLLISEAFRLAVLEQHWVDAHAVAVRAVEIGRTASDHDLVALGLNVAGRSLVGAGRADEGLGLLDEAMVAVVSGELSPVVAGAVYCSLIEACEEIAEWRRAGEWTDALTRWCDRQQGMVTFTGQCLTHRAHVLRLRGAFEAAAEAAHSAWERFAGAADERLSGGALYESGEVYRIRGDQVRAEDAYRRAGDQGHDPQPGLALLRLAQRRTDAAAATMRRLDAEWTTPIARIRLLPAYVEILLAAGDVVAAGGAAIELAELAVAYETVALRAAADGAQGAVLLASGDIEAALVRLRRAVEGWRSLEAPYEAARARVLIARACRALGDEDTATLELDAALRVFTELGASVDDADLSPSLEADRGHGLTPRELEVLRLVATGMTNQAIADELHLAVKTVDRHVANILTKLGVPTRTAATAFAYEHDLVRAPGSG
jgi:DNA-binding NarL/FixJ family response regulator